MLLSATLTSPPFVFLTGSDDPREKMNGYGGKKAGGRHTVCGIDVDSRLGSSALAGAARATAAERAAGFLLSSIRGEVPPDVDIQDKYEIRSCNVGRCSVSNLGRSGALRRNQED
jgi:hypothetical protein